MQLAYMRLALMRLTYMRLAYMRLAYMRLAYMRLAYMRLAYMRLVFMRQAYDRLNKFKIFCVGNNKLVRLTLTHLCYLYTGKARSLPEVVPLWCKATLILLGVIFLL
jgi:hypothetical protein